MYCSQHPDREAIGACVACSQAICPECKVEHVGRVYCNSCIQKMVAGGGAAASQQATVLLTGNTSGMGSRAAVPRELGEWNWGGFLLTWIWGIGNSVWWSFLVFVPYLGFMVMPWVLAFRGNQWAWQSRHWDSIEHFKRVQHTWAMWGLGITIGATLLVTAILVIGFLYFFYEVQKSGVRPL